MKKAVLIAVLAIALAALAFVRSSPTGAIPESEVPEDMREHVYEHLRLLGCVRNADGTWKCPDAKPDI